MLLIFGGETLQDFAFAMMVGVASGTYSSIFIASPVLTEWKEREPAYRSRRARIKEAMGYVPAFPEDNVVARIDEVERHVPPSAARPAPTAPEPPAPAPRRSPAEAPVADGGRPAGRARAAVEPPPRSRRGVAGARRPTPSDQAASASRRRSSRGAGESTGGTR